MILCFTQYLYDAIQISHTSQPTRDLNGLKVIPRHLERRLTTFFYTHSLKESRYMPLPGRPPPSPPPPLLQ